MSINKEAAQKELSAMRERMDELEKVINAPDKPEFEIGSWGYVWDTKEVKRNIVVKLESILHNEDFPFRCGIGSLDAYRYFEPITEAILPAWIEHDGGDKKPEELNSLDYIEVIYGSDDSANHTIEHANEQNWDGITHYRIIKRANK